MPPRAQGVDTTVRMSSSLPTAEQGALEVEHIVRTGNKFYWHLVIAPAARLCT